MPDGDDFGFATTATRQRVTEVSSLASVERAGNVVFLGPSRVGQDGPRDRARHPATVRDRKVRFTIAAGLALPLQAAQRRERLKGALHPAVAADAGAR